MILLRVFQKQHLFQIFIIQICVFFIYIQLSNLNYAIYCVLQTKYPGSVLSKMRCLMTLKHRWQFATYSRKMQEALWAHKFLQVIRLAPVQIDQYKQLLNITPESIGITDSPEQKQVEEQMKGFFKAGPKGPLLNMNVFTQLRLTNSLFANFRVVFFPTSITSQMTKAIAAPKKYCISVGLKGCGKTYAIVLNAMLNQKIITAIMDPKQMLSSLNQTKASQDDQIIKIYKKLKNGYMTKIFYWTIESNQNSIFQIYKNVFNIICMQCQEIHKQIEQISQKIQNLKKGDDQMKILFQKFCQQVLNCYNKKRIFVFLIVDQINAIAARFREAQRLVTEQNIQLSAFQGRNKINYLIGKNNDKVRMSLQSLYNYSLYNSSVNIQKNLIFRLGETPPEQFKQMVIIYGTTHSKTPIINVKFEEAFHNTDRLANLVRQEFERFIQTNEINLRQEFKLPQIIQKQCKKDKNKNWLPYLRPLFICELFSSETNKQIQKKLSLVNDSWLRSTTKNQLVNLTKRFIQKFVIKGINPDTDAKLEGSQSSLLERKVFASKLKVLLDKYKNSRHQLNVGFQQITSMNITEQTIKRLLDNELFYILGQRVYTRGPASFVAEIFDEVFNKAPDLLDIYTILRSFLYRKSGQGNDLEVAVALAFQNSPIINLVGNEPTVSYRMVPSVGKFEVLRYNQKKPNKFSCFEKCIQMLQEGIEEDSSKDSILCVPMKDTTIDVKQKNLITDESVGTDFVVISKKNKMLQINFTEITLGTGIIKKQRNFIKLLSSFEEMVRDNGSRKRLIDKYDIRVNLHLLTLNYSQDQNKIGVRQIFLKEVKSKENQIIKEQQNKTQSNVKFTEPKVQRFVSGNQIKPQNLNTNKQVQQKSKINLNANQIQNFQNNLVYVNHYIHIFKIEELQLLGNENEMLSMQAIIKLIKKKTEKEKK